MGEVYRARDPRLGREVAIKILPPALATNPDRLRRFEQEARAAAALNHPNILAVFDIGTSQATTRGAGGPATLGAAPYIVSELLAGETVRQRLAREGGAGRWGPPRDDRPERYARGAGDPATEQAALPVRQAIDYTVQIARGLAAAHEKGIAHRDLKPENLFLCADGHVKILDFGLAKLIEQVPDGAAATTVPTTPADTQPGLTLGTVGYMAPEQVRGLAVDYRADIFAFGAVLYEMLSGQRAFCGDTSADTLTAILKEDPPDLPLAERRIPPVLDRIVRRCLEKSPDRRFQSALDLAFALDAVSGSSIATAVPHAPAPRRRLSPVVLVPVIALVLVTAGVWVGRALFDAGESSMLARLLPTRAAPPKPVMRFSASLPAIAPLTREDGASPPVLALSPDGTRLVYVNASGKRKQLYLHQFERFDATPLPETEDAEQPFFSPDGQWVGFFAQRKLRKIPVAGGPPATIADLRDTPYGGVWSADGTIFFGTNRGVMRVPADGGVAEPATTLEKDESRGHRWPDVLPAGELVFITVKGEGWWVLVHSLKTGERRRLFTSLGPVRYTASGHLLYGSTSGDLLAVPFNAKSLAIAGPRVTVAEGLAYPIGATPQAAISPVGTLVYIPGGQPPSNTMAWMDQRGAIQKLPGPRHWFEQPRISPDGRRVAVGTREGGIDIWVYEFGRGTLTRVTFDQGEDETPVWMPDGKRLAFRRSGGQIAWKQVDGGGEGKLADVKGSPHVTSFTPDGRVLAFNASGKSEDIWLLSLDGTPSARPFLETPYDERGAMFSPDGRWLAYVSNESGRDEVYAQAFPGPGGKRQVSIQGGTEPVWRGAAGSCSTAMTTPSWWRR